MNVFLRKSLFACLLSGACALPAHATISYIDNGKITSPSSFVFDPFMVADTGTYEFSLQGENFDVLSAAITDPSDNIIASTSSPGTFSFVAEAGVRYVAALFGLVSGGGNAQGVAPGGGPSHGNFHLKISAVDPVPLPASFVLLGTALIGLLSVGRVRRPAGAPGATV